MINGYNVHYYLGNKKETTYKLWIAAHDPEQAETLCGIQARHRHGYGNKVTVIRVENEAGEKLIKRTVKREPVPEVDVRTMIQTIQDTNKMMVDTYKSLGKKHLKKGLFRW